MKNPLRIALAILPVVVFAGLALIFWRGLSGDPQRLPSTLINRPVPEFALEAVNGTNIPNLAAADLKQGRITLVNVFASWCGPCREEHPLLMELSRRDDIVLVGINNKDDPENARRFLATLGNPYARIGADRDGRVSIDWGVYGVPETFLVDGKGVVRFKVIGPLSPDNIEKALNPEIEKLKKKQ